MIGVLGGKLLHEIFLRSYPLPVADLFSDSPTAISDVAGASVILDLVLNFVGNFALMGVVLKGGDESERIKEGSPMFEPFCNDFTVI